MTADELKKIPFYFVSSLSLAYEHSVTYESEDGRLGYCDHTPKRKNGEFRKGFRHYRIDNKVYKTQEKFLEALADFNPNVVPIDRRPYQNPLARMKHEQDSKPKATVIDINKED